jgi:hypothetical protein
MGENYAGVEGEAVWPQALSLGLTKKNHEYLII